MEHASFNPIHTMPCHPADIPHYDTQPTPPRPVHHCLMLLSDSSDSDQDPGSSSGSSLDSSSDEEEDFQTVPIDDEDWTMEMVPERTFCIHENGISSHVNQKQQYTYTYGRLTPSNQACPLQLSIDLCKNNYTK